MFLIKVKDISIQMKESKMHINIIIQMQSKILKINRYLHLIYKDLIHQREILFTRAQATNAILPLKNQKIKLKD